MLTRVALAAACVLAGGLAVGHATGRASLRSATPCLLTLRLGTSRHEDPPGQFHVSLVFANDGLAPCRVHGWPQVELIGPDDPLFGSIYEVPHQAARSRTVTLAIGGIAHAVLTWLPPATGRRWVPGYVRVVVPTMNGPSFAMAVPWRFGAVLRQDAATHPGTYVGPVREETRQPVLGRPWGSYPAGQRGYGQPQPATIDNGGDPTGLVTHIHWTGWGTSRATGWGMSTYVRPGTAVAANPIRSGARVVAFHLGICKGRPSYNAVEWYFPRFGEEFNARQYINTCTGAYVGR